MANTYKSGCACGAVQLEISGDPAVQVYCHCTSCRSWLGAPIHAASLWPASNVKVVKGADKLGMYKRTENSHRQFCMSCGAPVLVGNRALRETRHGHVELLGHLTQVRGRRPSATRRGP